MYSSLSGNYHVLCNHQCLIRKLLLISSDFRGHLQTLPRALRGPRVHGWGPLIFSAFIPPYSLSSSRQFVEKFSVVHFTRLARLLGTQDTRTNASVRAISASPGRALYFTNVITATCLHSVVTFRVHKPA
jgi:hypothetical protein